MVAKEKFKSKGVGKADSPNKKLMRIICWIKGIYYTARRPDFWFDGLPISGCDFVEQKDGSLKCKVCGLMSKAKR